MHSSSLSAIVLCMVAQGALAQCVDAAVSPSANPVVPVKSPPVVASPSQAPALPGRGLIKTASAGTRDDVPAARSAATARPGSEGEQPRRGGTAMLLAALALMSGIALRRYGAPRP